MSRFCCARSQCLQQLLYHTILEILRFMENFLFVLTEPNLVELVTVSDEEEQYYRAMMSTVYRNYCGR